MNIFKKFFRKTEQESPIIIGATGGSGTRAVHNIILNAGCFMGENLNFAGDAMDFEPFLDEVINDVISKTHSLDYDIDKIPQEFSQNIINKLRKITKIYKKDIVNDGKWGWKNPRSIYILPFIHNIFPKLYFVHIVRDGRDMALSGNQNQTQKHYESFFGDVYDDEISASAKLWNAINITACDWAERNLGKRYYYLRIEDLCDNPNNEIIKLLHFLDIEVKNIEQLSKLVKTPSTLGRWKKSSIEDITKMEEIATDALKKFDYVNS